jgi:hypothetical protein
MLRMLPILGLMLLPRLAAGQVLAVCNVGGPGNTAQAKQELEKFLRHMEKQAGLAAGAMSGQYHSDRAGCLQYIKSASPALGVFDLDTYLQQSKALKLKPLAHMGGATAQRYHVLVREADGIKKLRDLKGKSLISVLDDMNFVTKVVFNNKLDAARDLKVKTTARPLKGIRNVARSRQDAALVDGMANEHLKELKLKVKLTSIYRSPGLPGLTLAVLGTPKDRKLVGKLLKSLPKLCTGPGQKMCKTFNIKTFTRAKARTYRKLERLYNGR